MPTNESFWLNEVRIPIKAIENIPVDIYTVSGLSAYHKRRIEISLAAQCGRVSRFDGNVLYSIKIGQQAEQACLNSLLKKALRVFSTKNLSTTTLGKVSEPVLERLLFELIRTKAQAAKYFYLGKRTLFQMHSKASTLGFFSVDLRILFKDGFAKIYLVPSSVALVNIEDTVRSQVYDLDLIRVCKFREKCPVWQETKRCRYAFPDRIGLYERKTRREALSESQKERYGKAYEGCPKFEDAGSNVVIVKATSKSTRGLAYPAYLLSAVATRQDVQIAKQTLAYRGATLQASKVRFDQTKRVIEKIFGTTDIFSVKDLQIPFQNLFALEGSPNSQNNRIGYNGAVLGAQYITTDSKQPRGAPFGGGWQFQRWGAYDRSESNRPFQSIHPYLIFPNTEGVPDLIDSLFECLATGYEKKSDFDDDFLGLNTDAGRTQYNAPINQIEKQDCFDIPPTDTEYLAAAKQIKRRYVAKGDQPDPNRIILIILPDEGIDPEAGSPLYFQLKQIFVEEGIPTQFMTLGTLRRLKDATTPFGSVLWNLFLDIYVKLGGKPWRLANQVSNVHCFIGVGFALNPQAAEKHIFAGVANVFDRYGNWLDITSAYEDLTNEEREDFFSKSAYLEGTSSFKISQTTTHSIVTNSLELYRERQTQSGTLPRNIILHKLGTIYQCEIEGMLGAISNTVGTLENCRIGIASIHTHHLLRLYGIQDPNDKTSHVILRGTRVLLDPKTSLLATTGRIYRRTASKTTNFYPGIGTPRPLLIENVIPDQALLDKYKISPNQFYSVNEISAHIYALTHLHWGSIRDDIRLPITVLYAKKVADIISKSGILRLNTIMSLRRPWFI